MSSFTNMPLKIESGGKVKISSGKASVDKAGITLTMDILHQNNSTAAIVTARYMIGLTSTVTFNGTGDSAPLFKSEVDVDSSVQSTHSFSGLFLMRLLMMVLLIVSFSLKLQPKTHF